MLLCLQMWQEGDSALTNLIWVSALVATQFSGVKLSPCSVTVLEVAHEVVDHMHVASFATYSIHS